MVDQWWLVVVTGNEFLDLGLNRLPIGSQAVTQPPRLQRDNTLAFSSQECIQSIGRGRFPFCLAIPLVRLLLWGSGGTPHNEFQGKAQVLPTVAVVETYVPNQKIIK